VDAGLTQRKDFKGNHFVVAIGFDTNCVYIHDPYQTSETEPIAVPHNVWYQAWTGDDYETMPIRSGIVPVNPLPAPGTIPVVPTDVPASANTNLALFRIKILMQASLRSSPKLDGPYPDGSRGNWVAYARREETYNVYETSGDWYRIGKDLWISSQPYIVSRLP
jgi:hypothetical protein